LIALLRKGFRYYSDFVLFELDEGITIKNYQDTKQIRATNKPLNVLVEKVAYLAYSRF
jgi:hypothetical protein